MQAGAGPLVERAIWVRNALRRRLIALPAGQARRHRARAARAEAFRKSTPSLAAAPDMVTVAALDDVGARRVPAAELAGLLGAEGAAVIAKLAALAAAGEIHPGEGETLIAHHPEAYHIGFAPELLATAEAYVGEPAYYLGAMLKCERADGKISGTRHWHLDTEDERMFRVIFYLTDVEAGCGPLEYVPLARSTAARTASGYRSGYLDDAAMAALVPQDAWQMAFGNAGDAITFDGTRVFHRAQAPTLRDRWSLTIAYISREPLELKPSARFGRAARARLEAAVGSAAMAYVPPALGR